MKHLAIFILLQILIIYYSDLQAQWVQTNGLYGGIITCFASNGTKVYTGTVNNDLFCSTTNGEYWTKINYSLSNRWVHSITISGSNILVGTDDSGVYISENDGVQWTQTNYGLTDTHVLTLASIGTNISDR